MNNDRLATLSCQFFLFNVQFPNWKLLIKVRFTVKKDHESSNDRNSPQCPNCTDIRACNRFERSVKNVRHCNFFTSPQDFHAPLKAIALLSMRSRALTSVQCGDWGFVIFFYRVKSMMIREWLKQGLWIFPQFSVIQIWQISVFYPLTLVKV